MLKKKAISILLVILMCLSTVPINFIAYAEDGAPDIVPAAITVVNGSVYKDKDSLINVRVENRDTGNSGPFDVSLYAGDSLVETKQVSDLVYDASADILFTYKPAAPGVVQLKAVVSNVALESATDNNEMTVSVTVYDSPTGYKGTNPLENTVHGTDKGDLIYTIGDSLYTGTVNVGSTYTVNYNVYGIPAGASIKTARLYAYYSWSKSGQAAQAAMTLNNNSVTQINSYSDTKGMNPYNYPSGTISFDATDKISGNGSYTAVLTNCGTNTISMYGIGLVIVYSDPNGKSIEYWLNDGADIISSATAPITSEEATTTTVFPGAIDTAKVEKAELISVVPGGDKGLNAVSFNDGNWENGVYNTKNKPVVDEREVTVRPGDNNFAIRDNGDYMVPSNAFLVVTYKTDDGAGPVNGAPDIVPTAIIPVDGKLYKDFDNPVKVQVENHGTANSGSFDVGLWAGASLVESKSVNDLIYGSSADVIFKFKPTVSGAIQLKAVVSNVNQESNTENNELTVSEMVYEKSATVPSYNFDGYPLQVVSNETFNGQLFVDGGHGLGNSPYSRSFQVPDGHVKWARLYVGIWGGNSSNEGELTVKFNDVELAPVSIGKEVAEGGARVYGATSGAYWVSVDVANEIKTASTNQVELTTKLVTGNFDGRLYGTVLVAALEQVNGPKVSCWVAEGNAGLNYITPLNSFTLTLPGSVTLSEVELAGLTTVYLAGNKGDQDKLLFNGQLLAVDAADGGGESPTGDKWDDNYFDLDSRDVKDKLAVQDNQLTFDRGDDTYLHPVLTILRIQAGDDTTGGNPNGIPDLVPIAISAVDGTIYKDQDNRINVQVKNRGTGNSGQFDVGFWAGNSLVDSKSITDLAKGSSTDVLFTYRSAVTGAVQLKTVVSNVYQESNTANNELSISEYVYKKDSTGTGTPVPSGYKGTNPLENALHEKDKGDLFFTIGDSSYLGAIKSGGTYTVNYNVTGIPAGASIKTARLYAYYAWSKSGKPAQVKMTLNNNSVSQITSYSDTKGIDPYNYPSGTISFNATGKISGNGTYRAVLTNNGPNEISIYGIGLVIVYSDPNGKSFEYWLNEGADIIFATDPVTSSEATTTTDFTGTIDTAKVAKARLITVVSGGDKGLNEISFNGANWKSGVYNTKDGLTVDEREVTVDSGGNNIAIRDNGDYMVPSNAFLVVTYKTDGSSGTSISIPGVAAPLIIQVVRTENITIQKNAANVTAFNGAVELVIPQGSFPEEAKIQVDQLDNTTIVIQEDLQTLLEIYEFTGTVTPKEKLSGCFKYDAQQIQGKNPNKLTVYFNDGTTWYNLGGKADLSANTITVPIEKYGIYAVVMSNKTFDDISSHWAKENIEILLSRGIVQGRDSQHYAPEQKVTRAEFTVLLTKALGIPQAADAEKVEFADVKSTHWAYEYIEAAAQAGLIKGDGVSFRPDDTISREEMMVLLVRATSLNKEAENLNPEGINQALNFGDEDNVADWAKRYVAVAVGQGLVKGVNANQLLPKAPTSRAQAAALITRILEFEDKI
ncbi:MAG: hypothetical protein CVV03_00450 [Firmicutes bacterium HGW-Firmicutes-8]|nr:MAG: hypothetical protein CVV03_00450 [Firmicutes bacterium HGW-Firmicutes-8]